MDSAKELIIIKIASLMNSFLEYTGKVYKLGLSRNMICIVPILQESLDKSKKEPFEGKNVQHSIIEFSVKVQTWMHVNVHQQNLLETCSYNVKCSLIIWSENVNAERHASCCF